MDPEQLFSPPPDPNKISLDAIAEGQDRATMELLEQMVKLFLARR